MQRNTPRRLIASTRSHSSRLKSAVSARRCMTPALLNAASRRPKLDTIRSIRDATCPSSLTSQPRARAFRPEASRCDASARTPSSWLSATTTEEPASAKAFAVASPIPEPAPVTSATLFSNNKFINAFLLVESLLVIHEASLACGLEAEVFLYERIWLQCLTFLSVYNRSTTCNYLIFLSYHNLIERSQPHFHWFLHSRSEYFFHAKLRFPLHHYSVFQAQ